MEATANWQLFLGGDKNALSQIFLGRYDDLYHYGLKLCGKEDVVKDAIQDLFLKLWKNRDNLKPIQSVKPYLFKSLRHHIQDSIELQKSYVQIDNSSDDSIFEITYSHEDFLINNQVNEDIKKKVIKALNELTSRQREAIYLRYFEDLEFETIAIIMETNVQSVRNTIYRGMEVMRDFMVAEVFFIMSGRIYFTL